MIFIFIKKEANICRFNAVQKRVSQVAAVKCLDYAGEMFENKQLINKFELEFRQCKGYRMGVLV